MIDVFETWFNQFTKAEQKKLLKHIKKNHFEMIEEYSSKPFSRIDKRMLEDSISSSCQNAFSASESSSK